jgi:hypothetical protein
LKPPSHSLTAEIISGLIVRSKLSEVTWHVIEAKLTSQLDGKSRKIVAHDVIDVTKRCSFPSKRPPQPHGRRVAYQGDV